MTNGTEGSPFPISPQSDQRPLEGIKVIDASNLVAGPMAANLLADFGADVIKLEHPEKGDSLRDLLPHKDNISLWWKVTARNKRDITLNLSEPEGAAIFKELAADADVVIENFRPGTMEDWGLGYEDLKEINPGIVMLRVTGYGQTGPYKDQPGFGRMATAMSGMSHITGHPDGPPLTPGFPLGDTTAGVFGALGVLFALYYRDAQGGEGQFIDIGLYEGVFRMLEFNAIEYDQLGKIRDRHGTSHPYSGGSDTYETEDGEYVEITLSTQSTWQYLCEAMGREDLAEDPRLDDTRKRAEHTEEISHAIQEFVGSRTREQVNEIFAKHNVPHAFVYDISDIFEDEHYRARQNLVRVPDEELGEAVIQGVVPKLSETPGDVRSLGPRAGEHNNEIYRDELGLSEERLEELRRVGVI